MANTLAGVAEPQANEVFSAQNVQQTIQNNGPQPSAVNYSDPMNIRARINAELGVDQAQSQYQTAIDTLRNFDLGAQKTQQAIEGNRDLSVGLVQGFQGEAANRASLGRLGYAQQAQTAQEMLLAKKQEADTRFNIANSERQNLLSMMSQAPGAGITLADTPEIATKKIADYQKKLEKDAEKKAQKAAEEEYKKNLKATAMQLGISTKTAKGGTMGTKDLEKAIAKEYSSKAAAEKALQQLELKSKQASIDKTYSDMASSSVGNSALISAENALIASKGQDGKVDPNTYIQQRQKYLSSVKGSKPSDFDTYYGGLLSPQEQSNLGISTVATRAENKTSTLNASQQKSLDAISNVKNQLANYRNLYDQYVGSSGYALTGPKAAELRSAKAALEFAVASAVGTGALQAADRAVVQDIIPDPTSMTGGTLFRGGKAGGLSAIDQAMGVFDTAAKSIDSQQNNDPLGIGVGNDPLGIF